MFVKNVLLKCRILCTNIIVDASGTILNRNVSGNAF